MWGRSITVSFIAFASFIFFLVYRCMQVDVNLVASDYYVQEIAYQDRIEELKNTSALQSNVQVKLLPNEASIEVRLPQQFKGQAQGTILCFRPSDAQSDYETPLVLDADGRQLIPVDQLAPGLWRIKVGWQQGERSYYDETAIMI